MKKVSILGITFLALIAIGTITFFNSCNSDPCKNVTCLNGGVCNTLGSCDCVAGYEGTDCSTISRDKFTDTWTVTDNCSNSGSGSYIASISNGSGIADVTITNMWGLFLNVVNATVDGNSISIPNQEPDGDGYKVQGSGTISSDGNTITMDYTVTDPGGVQDNCNNSNWAK